MNFLFDNLYATSQNSDTFGTILQNFAKSFKIFWNLLESYPLRGSILGSGAPGTNAVGASGAINGMKR